MSCVSSLLPLVSNPVPFLNVYHLCHVACPSLIVLHCVALPQCKQSKSLLVFFCSLSYMCFICFNTQQNKIFYYVYLVLKILFSVSKLKKNKKQMSHSPQVAIVLFCVCFFCFDFLVHCHRLQVVEQEKQLKAWNRKSLSGAAVYLLVKSIY